MHTLKVTSSQLKTLRDMIQYDMEISSCDAPDYTNMDLMQYYLDRCHVYHLVKEELET